MRVGAVCSLVLIVLLVACARVEQPVDTFDLSSYPMFFYDEGSFDATIVIDDRAPQADRVSASLLASSLDARDRIREYPSFNAILEEPVILIGSCSQEPPNRFVNLYVDCLSMREDQAIIRIIETNDALLLEIVGITPEATRRAVEALIDGDPRIVGEDVEVRVSDDGLVIGEPT